MNNSDERDYAEEAENWRLMHDPDELDESDKEDNSVESGRYYLIEDFLLFEGEL